MKRTKIGSLIFALLVIIFASCSHEIKPLEYGNDNCAYCKMQLADKHFGAEIMTKTGKIYIFDSFECMTNFKKSYFTDEREIAKIVVVDASNEGNLIDAHAALYLHSYNFPSPMGAYISAFGNENGFNEFQKKYQGTRWDYAQATDSVLNNTK